jgi:hypothetical protein
VDGQGELDAGLAVQVDAGRRERVHYRLDVGEGRVQRKAANLSTVFSWS